ncbi:pyruvate formate-lyase activating enzyme [Pyrodictium delaneyi]|uniref:Pyruvate formate-lyase activating enzyme n=1 Tax=Pyrodictium delaneyi TaxID=1273541 RepID=A0A0P0N3H4_9CREN|nr:radical SAM protein [Pyrodictium delaneyi]ALL01471.1 pyruvate formate-lyase activating enzyme [Pyrodictium delaneyi]OWJ54614.1 radical SAM protein [Pyrodictium delaneyi]
MPRCALCGREALVSESIGVCAQCLRERPEEALPVARRRHQEWRIRYGLPPVAPRDPEGLPCRLCVNECRIPRGGRGYCGVWVNRGGRLEPLAGPGQLLLFTYLDPHPTNCVAEPVCPAATSRGYPQYTFTRGVEKGFYNLAVFAGGCPLDCVFCQNPEHKAMAARGRVEPRYVKSLGEFVDEALDTRVTCVCFFGGDPTPQMPMLISVARRALERARGRGLPLRVCWETDGLANPAVFREAARLSLESGGIVKVDWKAWSPGIYEALTGVDGQKAVRRLMANTRIVAEMAVERPEPPLLVVSMLLVPGYVDAEEVRGVAGYIAGLMDEYSVNIPMVLLAFHPDHRMRDLPPTSRRHALEARRAALEAGIWEVYLGNVWLLGDYY